MSGASWQWREGSGGAGYLQRIASNSVYTASQRAYRAYIDHGANCPHCPEDCESAADLWRAYQDTRDYSP